MAVDNQHIISVFEELADLLEIQDANPFRIRAYRSAARKLEALTISLADEVAAGRDLTSLDGIGKDLAAKIEEIIATGSSTALTSLKAELPEDLPTLTRIQGLGPKRVGRLYRELGIEGIDDLQAAIDDGRVESLKGFGKKLIAGLLLSLKNPELTETRYLRASVENTVRELCDLLRSDPSAHRVQVAGSFRRGRETVGDLDILVAADESVSLMQRVIEFPGCQRVLAHGTTKSSVILQSGIQVDVRVVPDESFGAALHYFTGSQAHNIELRHRAQQQKLKLNEYGLFDGDVSVAGKQEDEIFKALNLSPIPPELREARGELAAAEDGVLPKLLEEGSIRGDLHMHSTWSDGRHDIRAMAEAAASKGYAYIAITDHSQRLTVANGLTAERVRKQIDEIRKLNESQADIHIFCGLEVDILEDGSLDMDDDVLSDLDVVIGSVHSLFQLSRDQQTDRIRRAMDHPCFTMMGHATGRLLLQRPPYEVNIDAILDHAAQRGCWMEINANPRRLDLNEVHAREAICRGIPLAVNTDAHHVDQLELMRHGVIQARRAWAEPSHIGNTRSLEAFKKVVKQTRS